MPLKLGEVYVGAARRREARHVALVLRERRLASRCPRPTPPPSMQEQPVDQGVARDHDARIRVEVVGGEGRGPGGALGVAAEQHQPVVADDRARCLDQDLPVAEVGVEAPVRHEAHVVLRHQRRATRDAEAVDERELRRRGRRRGRVEVARAGEVAGRIRRRGRGSRTARPRRSRSRDPAETAGSADPSRRRSRRAAPSRSSSWFGRRSTAHISSVAVEAAHEVAGQRVVGRGAAEEARNHDHDHARRRARGCRPRCARSSRG